MTMPEAATVPAVGSQVERKVRPLAWTEPCDGPTEDGCRYDHVSAPTPFGRFLITWKSWKPHQWVTVDEVPWGDEYEGFGSWPTVEAAKAACEAEFARRLDECF